MHGPELAPRLAITSADPLAPGVSGGPRNGFVALDLPIGAVHSLSLGTPVALSIGMRLVISMPIE